MTAVTDPKENPVPDRIAPNPYSPYADADPDARHIFASLLFFPDLKPGGLALTACEAMAVVPLEALTDTADSGPLPDGMCPLCVAVAQGGDVPEREEPAVCEECGSGSSHGRWCALCRQDLHEEWWPTRDTKAAADHG